MAGSNEHNTETDYYLLTSSSFVNGIGDWQTCAYWVWCENNNDLFVTGQGIYIDSQYQSSANTHYLTAGWHHICRSAQGTTGYVNSLLGLYGKENETFMFAMPSYYMGKFQITPAQHTSILRGHHYV